LRELIKHTPETHLDHANLTEAAERIKVSFFVLPTQAAHRPTGVKRVCQREKAANGQPKLHYQAAGANHGDASCAPVSPPPPTFLMSTDTHTAAVGYPLETVYQAGRADWQLSKAPEKEEIDGEDADLSELLMLALLLMRFTKQVFLFNDLIIRAKVIKLGERYLFEESVG